MIHSTAEVAFDTTVGAGVSIWHYAHIREGASVGAESTIGRGVYIGPGVVIGPRCKVQNYALVYEPAVLGEGVFVGPSAVLTNDLRPRAVNPDWSMKSGTDWAPVGVAVGDGASIGAHATCVAPVRIGRWAMVAAGAVVVRDVPDYALVGGNPARQIGWVGPSGQRLVEEFPDHFVCPTTAQRFRITTDGALVETTP